MVTVAGLTGDVLLWESGGTAGHRGADRSSAQAAHGAATRAAERAIALGFRNAHVIMRGPGFHGPEVMNMLRVAGMNVVSITDVTPEPFNGCRPRKRRRLG
jgi:small subunit ribosomal protein S11